MTVEKAIEEVRFNMSHIGLGARAARRVKEAKEMAINALEKQIAKKPVGLKKNICPNCSWGIVMTTQKYCDECGQKLDR